MIILFHLKLDKFYCIGFINQLKVICYDFFHMKMSYYWFNRQELLQKAKDRYYDGGGKEIAAEYYFENRYVLKANARNV